MELNVIKENVKIIQDCETKLKVINTKDVDVELRVFTKNGWSNIDFKPKNKAILNMVIYQIKIDLEHQIKKSKQLIKEATELK